MKKQGNTVAIAIMISEALKTGNLSAREIANRFDIGDRRAYRILGYIETAYPMLDKDFENRYFIPTKK